MTGNQNTYQKQQTPHTQSSTYHGEDSHVGRHVSHPVDEPGEGIEPSNNKPHAIAHPPRYGSPVPPVQSHELAPSDRVHGTPDEHQRHPDPECYRQTSERVDAGYEDKAKSSGMKPEREGKPRFGKADKHRKTRIRVDYRDVVKDVEMLSVREKVSLRNTIDSMLASVRA